MFAIFREKVAESVSSVLPITAIVLLLSITLAPMDPGVLALFIFSAIALVVGMALFTLGAGMSISPLGEGIGVQMSRSKWLFPKIVVCFVLGVLITIAEPDLQMLAKQVPSVPNMVLILSVAIGVGFLMLVSLLRTRFHIKLSYLLMGFYLVVLVLAFLAPENLVPTAFDSGGVTTGPITVPFIMAFGAGMAAIGTHHHSEDSFGLVALCSVGPILSVLILSVFFPFENSAAVQTPISEIETTKDAFFEILHAIPHYAGEMLVAFLPIVAVFILFQLFFRRFHGRELPKAIIGFVYTYIGLVLFLTGANVGFLPAGQLIGAELAGNKFAVALIPIGMIIGWFTVAAEPAVHVLKKQVEEISNGTITQKSIGTGLSVGVAISVGIAMLRVLTGIPILPFMICGYILSLVISFFVPPLYTGVAFDSGGVASGPMTTTFILPFALGACEALGGNVMTDAFGVVAMVAITPLITIQCIGLATELRRKSHRRKIAAEFAELEDSIVYYDNEKDGDPT